ncbi:MFS transporter [Enterococcus plantarum]|uniref:MFS transporter n=1 Tax=Enterococcus plantarum TaxID=1077675 RepID=UPI003BF46132
MSPLLPTLTKLYNISPSISGWMVSAYAIGYALFALISGPISDGRDRKKVMSVGLVAFAISTLICGFANSFITMILFRFLAGVSASFVTPHVWASIPTLATKDKIVQMMGMASSGLAVSQLVGVPIASYLAAISWQTPFFSISFASIVLVVVIRIILPSLNVESQNSKSIFKIYGELLKNKLAVKYLIAYLVFQTGTFSIITFIGSWLSRDFNLGVSNVGTAMMAIGAGNLVGTLFGNKLITRCGIPKSLFTGIILLSLFYFVMPFSPTILTAEICLMLAFLVNGFIFPIFMTILQSTTTTARSTVSSLSNTAMYTGTSIGGIVGGILFTTFKGFYGVSFFTVIMYLAALLIYKMSGIFSKKSNIL